MKGILLIVFLALAVAGCAPPTVVRPVLQPAPPGLRAEELSTAVWTAQPMLLRFHQTARFRFRGREVEMIGLMELDTRHQEARLVAINEMGVKLFDLSVTGDGVRENYLLPQLARYPRFAEAVGASLRRIFLAPRPDPSEEALHRAGGGYVLRDERMGRAVEFLFGGDPVRLVEKSLKGEGKEWRVVYLDYHHASGVDFPRDIELEDRRAGYRLDLRIEKMERRDERAEP